MKNMKYKKYLAGTLAALVAVSVVIPGGAGTNIVQAAAVAEESVPENDITGEEEKGVTEANETEAGSTEANETEAGSTEANETEADSAEANETEAGSTEANETEAGSTEVNAVAASAAELQQCIDAIAARGDGERGSLEEPVPVKITAGFDVDVPITVPAGVFVKIYGEAAEGTDTLPVLNNTNKNKQDGSVFQVNGGLTLEAVTITAGMLSGVYVSETGTLCMESDAVIQKGNVFITTADGKTIDRYYGGGVTNYGTFVMNGGTIRSCYNSYTGAMVSIEVEEADADGNMVKKTLWVSDHLYGGGVYNAGNFTMTGGEITGNQIYAHGKNNDCAGYGSGVANGTSGNFTMTGGTISGNKGEMGAGVYNAGVMNLAGGTIQANIGGTDHINDNGGGMSHISVGGGVYNDGTLTFTSGSVTENTAGKGAGVYTTGVFSMNGAKALISKNTASVVANGRGFSCGGGVYAASGTFELKAGKISSNIANNTASSSTDTSSKGDSGYELDTGYTGYGVVGDGGGVFVANGGAVFTMTGGEISGNVARGNAVAEDIARQGGGVYVQGGTSGETSDRTAVPGRFVMSGGKITKNTALSGGDGVYIGNYDYFVTTNVQGGANTREEHTYQFTGAAGFELSGAAAITGNGNTSTKKEDISLSDSVQIQITAPMTASGKIQVNAGNKAENAVMAVYSEAGMYKETDTERFVLGSDDIRTVVFDSEKQALVLEKEELNDTYTIGLSFESAAFDGQAKEPEVTVTKADGTVLPESEYTVSYQENTDAGTATAVIEAAKAGNYKGSISKDFEITPRDFFASGSQIEVAANDLTQGTYSVEYTGKEIKPSVTLISLKDQERDGYTLLRGKDYTVTYSDNIDPVSGTGKVIVTGIRNYTGEYTFPFTIRKKAIGEMTFSPVADQTYTGSAITPVPTITDPTITDGNNKLKKGTDYTVSYSNNMAAGTATITITGKGVYSGSKNVTFRIAAKSINGASVQVTADQVYTGKEIRPVPAVKLDGKILTKDTDYTLSYKNNKKTGKAAITITGKGNYAGTRTTTFRIVPKRAALKSVASVKKKQLTVKWKKDAQASGYQVMIAKNVKFTSGKKIKTVTKNTKLTKTFTGLKRGKKYYVAVRSYKIIDGKKAYGAWSSYRSKKVK